MEYSITYSSLYCCCVNYEHILHHWIENYQKNISNFYYSKWFCSFWLKKSSMYKARSKDYQYPLSSYWDLTVQKLTPSLLFRGIVDLVETALSWSCGFYNWFLQHHGFEGRAGDGASPISLANSPFAIQPLCDRSWHPQPCCTAGSRLGQSQQQQDKFHVTGFILSLPTKRPIDVHSFY